MKERVIIKETPTVAYPLVHVLIICCRKLILLFFRHARFVGSHMLRTPDSVTEKKFGQGLGVELAG